MTVTLSLGLLWAPLTVALLLGIAGALIALRVIDTRRRRRYVAQRQEYWHERDARAHQMEMLMRSTRAELRATTVQAEEMGRRLEQLRTERLRLEAEVRARQQWPPAERRDGPHE